MKAVDLFCGVGGLSMGFRKAGIPMVAAYDNWDVAVAVYGQNMRHAVKQLDLLDVEGALEEIKPLRPDLIVGGPPCQDFSSAGKRTEGSNANLTTAFAQIVASCRPRVVVMENVPRVRTSAAYRQAVEVMRAAGFNFFETTLDASVCNVPQIRKRFFAVGWQGPQLPNHKKLTEFFHDSVTKHRLTVAEYMAEELDIEHYYRHPRNYARRAIFSVHEPSPTVRGVNRPVPPSYKGNHLDSASPDEVRPLTSYERSRIQTFPKSWKWSLPNVKTSKTDVEQLIGNAVPVNLAHLVGCGIKEVFA